jgi:hypothetical protein
VAQHSARTPGRRTAVFVSAGRRSTRWPVCESKVQAGRLRLGRVGVRRNLRERIDDWLRVGTRQ